jgi:hypothetical protein
MTPPIKHLYRHVPKTRYVPEKAPITPNYIPPMTEYVPPSRRTFFPNSKCICLHSGFASSAMGEYMACYYHVLCSMPEMWAMDAEKSVTDKPSI